MGFKRLEADDFVVSAQAQTQTCWTGNEPALTVDSMFTQSNQINGQSGVYYATVFNTQSGAPNFEAQFEIAYGNSTGGGASAPVCQYVPVFLPLGKPRHHDDPQGPTLETPFLC